MGMPLAAFFERQSNSFLRWLGENEHDDLDFQCAAFCIPHLITPMFKHATKRKGVPIHKGTCQDQGYSSKILDKTFSAFSYSLDVELYGSTYDDGGDN